MMKYIYTILLLLSFSCDTFSQRVGLMIGGGVNYYYGDMNDRVLTHEKLLRGYIAGGLLYRLSPRFDIWGAYIHGSVAGDDSLAVKYAIRNRNLKFESKIDEASLNLGFRILGDRKGKTRRVVPYIFAGIGGYHFNPTVELNGQNIDLQKIGTEGQYIEEDIYPKPYELYQISVPAGIGVEFVLSHSWKIRVEAANHFLFTDYLDDVSGKYPDSASLAATPNGALAVMLSSNVKDGSFPDKSSKRGNAIVHDSFTHVGIWLMWTPSKPHSNSGPKKKKKAHCPAYH